MEFLEQIQAFLPTYLTPEHKAQLYQELTSFPDNYNYYLHKDDGDALQGDVWGGLPIYNVVNREEKEVSGIILSNSCDISLANNSDRRRKVVFCPVLSLERYRQQLLAAKNGETESVENIISDIKKQKITYLFYLPAGGLLEEEGVVFFDDVHSMFIDIFEERKNSKIFTLSQYGFYLFLLKLSIHFTRFQEGVVRFEGSSSDADR